MASVHRHHSGRTPYLFASYLGEDGRWKFRSTKETKRSKAMEVAIEYERAAKKAREGTLTVVQVRKVLSDMVERTNGDKVEHKTVEAFFKDWLDHKETAKSSATAERYKGTLKKFKESIGPKAKLSIAAVTTQDVQAFLNGRLKADCSVKTVSVDRKSLSSVFGAAVKQSFILQNPVLATEIPKVKSQQRHAFTSAQIGMLLDHANHDDWRTAILLGYFTGARLSDCVNMKWDNVSFTAGEIHYTQSKTDTEIKIPIHAELNTWLQMRASSDKPEEFLCPTLAGRESGGAHGLSYRFKAIMGRAGIDPGTVVGGKKPFSKLSFHSLRHSFNSALANADVSQELRMRLTGHKSTDVNRTYTHHEKATLKIAVEKLPKVTK